MGSRSSTFDYIRRTFGVPAHKGQRITWNGKSGVIVKAIRNPPWLRVRMDGERELRTVRPSDLGYPAQGDEG